MKKASAVPAQRVGPQAGLLAGQAAGSTTATRQGQREAVTPPARRAAKLQVSIKVNNKRQAIGPAFFILRKGSSRQDGIGREGQFEAEGAALAHLALEFDRTAMRRGHRLYNRKPEPAALGTGGRR